MKKIKIVGGGKIKGDVKISGAKNAASKMIIACLLTSEEVVLTNVPRQQETEIAAELVRLVGGDVEIEGDVARIRVKNVEAHSTIAQSQKNRLSILLAAPLLHRIGQAEVVKPEGDRIGLRPVNFHLDALKKMGARVTEGDYGWNFSVERNLKGIAIELPYPSVGATETVIFAGVLAEGKTVIKNAAVEPEIQDLIMMLQKMGAIIEMGANREIVIEGVRKLNGCEHRILPDRLEAASYACVALATRGEVFCRGAEHKDMMTFLNAVRKIGGSYKVVKDGIYFYGAEKYSPIEVTTDTYPGFSTDWQQPFAVVLTQCEGVSYIHETVYEDRFKYTEVLNEMGADISVEYMPDSVRGPFQLQNYRQTAKILGVSKLRGMNMTVPDIRAGLAYIVAALVAEGESVLDGVHHLDRGYEHLEEKLESLGANISII
jgi:UDP-N-acetylglucosamine 1-carboxyvinyltransferase